MSQIWFGQARALLSALGGALAAAGVVNAGTWEIVTGAGLTIGAALWSAYEKLRAR